MDSRPAWTTRLWQAVFYGHTEGLSRRERDQIFELNVYSFLGWMTLTLFGVLHIFVERSEPIGQFELLLAGLVLLNAIGLRLTRSIVLAQTVFLLAILLVLAILLITGGTANTGIFWLFVYPILAFFLVGQRRGVWWIVALGLMIGGAFTLSRLEYIHLPYPPLTIRQLIASLMIVAIGVYIYQGARERATNELNDNRRDLQEYLDHMTTLNLKIGPSGNILFANRPAQEASGLGSRLVGTSFLECTLWCFEPAVKRRVEAAFYKALSGYAVNYDERIETASSTGSRILTVNFSLLPIPGKSGHIKYILVEARDISAEQAVDRAKSEFVALASERLADPLSAVSSTTERLMNGSRLQPEQLKELRRIYDSSHNMAALIDDMLLVAKLELGNLPLSPGQYSPVKLAHDTVKEIEEASHLAGRTLDIYQEYHENLPDMSLDSFVFQTILQNLTTNAVTYTADGGHIYIRLNQIEEKLYSESKGSLQIVIQDNGRGIPLADQPKVFTKFFRASNGHRRDQAGTGLGLYIVKSLVEYVGGATVFRSEENVGTTFIVTLPIEGMTAKK